MLATRLRPANAIGASYLLILLTLFVALSNLLRQLEPAKHDKAFQDVLNSSTKKRPSTKILSINTLESQRADSKEERLPYKLIFERAGQNVSDELLKGFPPFRDVTDQYGRAPIIHGLDRCQAFRHAVPLNSAKVAPAGLFNTGTNLLWQLLKSNCDMTAGKGGIMWQVPWGKHKPPSIRHLHLEAGYVRMQKMYGYAFNLTNILPVVLVRDPLSWMKSICRHPYGAVWRHQDLPCPKLLAINKAGHFEPNPIRVTHDENYTTHHSSLVALWNEFHREWLDIDPNYPRLLVRFEDLQFYQEEVIDGICRCVGGKSLFGIHDGRFQYRGGSAKGDNGAHKGSSNMVTALKQSAEAAKQNRTEWMSQADLDYTRQYLDAELLRLLHYE